MYKTETHLHTKEISPCGLLRAAEMVELYHQAGYKTICITDHVKQMYFDDMGDIPWKDKVTTLLWGYHKAKHAAKKYGMNVIMSAELLLDGSFPNHYIVYGITKKFLIENPDFCKLSIEEFAKIPKKYGVFIVQAHPYRDEKNYPTPEFVDAFEVYNSNQRHRDHSEESLKTAKENGLYLSAGSDAHRVEDVAGSGLLTEKEIKNAKDLINAIKSGKAKLIGCEAV